MLSLAEAHRLIASQVPVLPPERVSLATARGRVLRESVAAAEDLPAFHRSAYDGYALRAADTPGRLRQVGEIAAGATPLRAVGAGECMRIFTGGELPPGADTIAMQEDCRVAGEQIEIPVIAEGHGVRRRGEDARSGEVLLPAGLLLGPVELSLLAQLGHTQPWVAPKWRAVHVATGAELVPPEQTPGPGQIRDSNSTLVAALVSEAGGALVAQRRTGDELAALVAAIAGPESWDLLLISGGASVGDYDLSRAALEQVGFAVHFHALNLRPGKPLIFATRGAQWAFVLPGNPLSHFVCWQMAVRYALEMAVRGEASWNLSELPLGGKENLPGHARETWWPARVILENNRPVVLPLRWQSSGDLTRLVGVNALVRVPSKTSLTPGEFVSVRPW